MGAAKSIRRDEIDFATSVLSSLRRETEDTQRDQDDENRCYDVNGGHYLTPQAHAD